MSILSHLSSQVKVLFGPMPPVASDAGRRTVSDPSLLLFPQPPIVIPVMSLDLMGRRGCTPEKSVGKEQRIRQARGPRSDMGVARPSHLYGYILPRVRG